MVILAGFASTTLLFAAMLVSDVVRYPDHYTGPSKVKAGTAFPEVAEGI